jgi:hypothetical protein
MKGCTVMSKLLRLRFLDATDTADDNTGTYTEVHCDPLDRRGYFKKYKKSNINAADTTVRINQGKVYEAKVLGFGWRSIDRAKMEKHLSVINKERATKGWPAVELPAEEN